MAARMYRRVIYIIVWTMIDQLTILITYVPRSIQLSVEVPSSSYHDHTIHVFYLDAYSLNRLGSVLFQTSMDSSFHLHRKDSFLRSLYVRRWFSRGYHGSPLSLREWCIWRATLAMEKDFTRTIDGRLNRQINGLLRFKKLHERDQ
jgi:hypothetical protein